MQSYERATKERIDAALKKADTTVYVLIAQDALKALSTCFAQCFADKPWVIVADTNTYQAAGPAVAQQMQSAGTPQAAPPLIFQEQQMHAETKYVKMIEEYLNPNRAIPIAVGSGTINDLVKVAAHNCNRQYLSVATAASVDGYTAYGSSITHNHFKQTFFCPAPKAVIGDLQIIRDAPEGMNAAGYADLIAKVPAGADWMLSDAFGDERINPGAWDLVQTELRQYVADPEGVARGDFQVLAALMEGLSMSGIAMQFAQSSRPASGAEHLFSHLWDNQHHTYQGQTPSHGFKVGIGSLATEAMHAAALQLEPQDLKAEPHQIEQFWPTWDQVQANIKQVFGTDQALQDQVLQESQAKYLTREQLVIQLQNVRAGWPALKERIRSQVMGPEAFRAALKLARAPYRSEDIGIEKNRLRNSYAQAQLIRRRYSILDFVRQSGLWNQITDQLFAPNGFWGQN